MPSRVSVVASLPMAQVLDEMRLPVTTCRQVSV